MRLIREGFRIARKLDWLELALKLPTVTLPSDDEQSAAEAADPPTTTNATNVRIEKRL
jgi:hypothetical protein